MAKRRLLDALRRRARTLRARAVDELLENERRSEAVGAALRRVQQGRRVLDERSARMLAALGFATQQDLERVSQKIGRLRKRMMALLDELDDA
ncbi:MAG: hypothetical protein V3T05_00640 [Myxococcota bacterium]